MKVIKLLYFFITSKYKFKREIKTNNINIKIKNVRWRKESDENIKKTQLNKIAIDWEKVERLQYMDEKCKNEKKRIM